MPAKKKKSQASRCRPVLSNITNKQTAAEAREHQKKQNLIVEDFKRSVSLRIEQIKEEQDQLEQSILDAYENYRKQLQPWHNITVKELLQSTKGKSKTAGKNIGVTPKPTPRTTKQRQQQAATQQDLALTSVVETVAATADAADGLSGAAEEAPTTSASAITYPTCSPQTEHQQEEEEKEEEAQEGTIFKEPRLSEISALCAETNIKVALTSKSKKKKAVPAAAGSLTATRSSSRTRKPISEDSMPAPSTLRAPRTKKMMDGSAFVTPAGQRVVPNSGAHLLITPKFDPRVPLPPGTVARRPLPNEVPMSITGSPLRITPPKPQLKAIMSSFLNTLEQKVPQVGTGELRQFHSLLDRFIDGRPSTGEGYSHSN